MTAALIALGLVVAAALAVAIAADHRVPRTRPRLSPGFATCPGGCGRLIPAGSPRCPYPCPDGSGDNR